MGPLIPVITTTVTIFDILSGDPCVPSLHPVGLAVQREYPGRYEAAVFGNRIVVGLVDDDLGRAYSFPVPDGMIGCEEGVSSVIPTRPITLSGGRAFEIHSEVDW